MDSLIERLRRQHAWAFDGAQATSLWLEAANELERLSSIVGEQRETIDRVRAAIDYVPPRERESLEHSISADRHLSLRQCARKHGVGVGIVRGIRSRAALTKSPKEKLHV